jgi:hypothetical protein
MTWPLMIVRVLMVLAPAAPGVSDPPSDLMGVYFDEFGEQICEDNLQPFVPFSLWIVYTNPSATSILGYELGYHTTAEFLQLGLYPPCGIIWIDPPELDNLYVICGEPVPTSAATPLLRIDYMALGFEDSEAVFYVEKASGSIQPGNNPHVILADGSLMEVQAHVPAYTTLCCGVPTENLGWGSIKSLFR